MCPSLLLLAAKVVHLTVVAHWQTIDSFQARQQQQQQINKIDNAPSYTEADQQVKCAKKVKIQEYSVWQNSVFDFNSKCLIYQLK